MNTTINEILFPAFLFAVYFCIASILYTSTNVTTTSQNIATQHLLVATKSEAVQFDKFYSQVKQMIQEDIVENPHSPIEIAIPPIKDEEIIVTLPQIPEIKEQEIIKVKPVNIHTQTEDIINKLTKRQSLKLFKPLGIKRKNGTVEKTLGVTKAEILDLFKQEPEKVTKVLQEYLPELFLNNVN